MSPITPEPLPLRLPRPQPAYLRGLGAAMGSTVLAVPTIESLHCEAVVWIQYDQRNTLARVEGTIENGDCAASQCTCASP